MSATREGPTDAELLSLEDGFVIGLKVHPGTEQEDRFDPTRVGLDHIAWWVDSREELEAWLRRAEELGAENSGIVAAPDGLYLNVKDPDGTALEFYVPASGFWASRGPINLSSRRDGRGHQRPETRN